MGFVICCAFYLSRCETQNMEGEIRPHPADIPPRPLCPLYLTAGREEEVLPSLFGSKWTTYDTWTHT